MSDGEKIRELRKQKKMTQEELAARVGVTKAQISAIEQVPIELRSTTEQI